MNTLPMLTQNSITRLETVPGKLIFKVYLNHSPVPAMVVKQEAGSANPKLQQDFEISVAWSSRIMKNIQNEQINMKRMQTHEYAEMKRAVGVAFGGAPNSLEYRNFFNPTFANGAMWLKMPVIDGISGSHFYSREDKILLPKVKEIIRNMSLDSNWLELGKVLAADTFSGNYDRFSANGREWVNLGNLVFVNGTVIGLDTWDPSSPHKNFITSGRFDGLRVLNNEMELQNYARRITQEIGFVLARALDDIGMSKLVITLADGRPQALRTDHVQQMFEPFQPVLCAGIRAGATAMRTYLVGKMPAAAAQPAAAQPAQRGVTIGGNRGWQRTQPTAAAARPAQPAAAIGGRNPLPAGVVDRMRFLGWI